jgi:hypothetical protein
MLEATLEARVLTLVLTSDYAHSHLSAPFAEIIGPILRIISGE